MPVPGAQGDVPVRQGVWFEPLVFRPDHDRIAAAPVGGSGDGEAVRERRIQIANRFPAGVVDVQFQFPLALPIADGPDGAAAGEDLRDHKGGAGVGNGGAAGKELAVEMEGSLAAVDQADVGERKAVFVPQRRKQQAGVEAGGSVTSVQFHAGPCRDPEPSRPAELPFNLPFTEDSGKRSRRVDGSVPCDYPLLLLIGAVWRFNRGNLLT